MHSRETDAWVDKKIEKFLNNGFAAELIVKSHRSP